MTEFPLNRQKRSGKFIGLKFTIFLLASFIFTAFAQARQLEFNIIRLGNGSRAVLVVGGIQGDEPGGFSAATLLATRYEIGQGELWVVPNLNFPSIIKRSRGLHGDMNRKFAILDEKDPEYATVRRIQELISDPHVGLVLNLHDGSGYYRHQYVDNLHNPRRWGQSIIIDQENLENRIFMGALGREAEQVARKTNSALLEPGHAVHVHNTNTAAGDVEMEKSLSYYAVRANKAAFGIEASKEFTVAQRAYYHLLMVESFLEMAGIEFKRDFELTPAGVERALGNDLGVSFVQNRIFLPLEDARPTINYLPMPRGGHAAAITSKPIMAVLPCGKNAEELCVHYGNRTIALIRPDWREIDEGLDAVPILVDGKSRLAAFGQLVDAREAILVRNLPGYRVNAIGFDRGKKDESGVIMRHTDFEPRFSLDRGGRIFRIEVYKGGNFAGMFLVRFNGKNGVMDGSPSQAILPDGAGPESNLGF